MFELQILEFNMTTNRKEWRPVKSPYGPVYRFKSRIMAWKFGVSRFGEGCNPKTRIRRCCLNEA